MKRIATPIAFIACLFAAAPAFAVPPIPPSVLTSPAIASVANSTTFDGLRGVETRPPSMGDDNTQGYAVGNYWKDQNSNLWKAVDVTTGKALWTTIGKILTYPCDLNGGAYTAYSVEKVCSAYSGNAFQVTRASDSTTLDVPFISAGANALPIADFAKADNFCTGTTCTETKIYNQASSGSTHDCAPRVAAGALPYVNTVIGGIRAFHFNANYRFQNNPGYGAQCSDTAFSSTSQATSVFYIGRATLSGNVDLMFQWGGPSAFQGFWYASNYGFVTANSSGGGNTMVNSQGTLTSQPDFMGMVASATATTTYANEKAFSTTVASLQNWTDLTIGTDPHTENYTWYFEGDAFGWLTYNSALTSTQVDTLRQSAYSAFPIIPQWRQTLFLIGDSLTAGQNEQVGQNYPAQFVSKLSKGMRLYNMGWGGHTAQAFSTETQLASAVATAGPNSIVVLDMGTNDLFATPTPTTPAATYAYLKTVVQNIRAQNATIPIIISTMIDRANGSAEANRQAYNTLIRAGIGGDLGPYTYLNDVGGTSSPLGVSGASTNTNLFETGQVHLTSAGYGIKASWLYSTLSGNNLLR